LIVRQALIDSANAAGASLAGVPGPAGSFMRGAPQEAASRDANKTMTGDRRRPPSPRSMCVIVQASSRGGRHPSAARAISASAASAAQI
jgi:hypothetical protein